MLLTMSYDGHQYFGWQRQRDKITVQETLENACLKVFKQKINALASSRTDCGVHARVQIVTIHVLTKMSTKQIMRALNITLPYDIRIEKVHEVNENFHPMKNSQWKVYRYYFDFSKTHNVYFRQYALWTKYDLDLSLMKRGSKLFVGRHSFHNYFNGEQTTKTCIRNIKQVKWGKRHGLWYFEVTGDGFLKNMVRMMVGALIELGRGKISLDDIEKSLCTQSIKKVGFKAPAHALFLWDVVYSLTDLKNK